MPAVLYEKATASPREETTYLSLRRSIFKQNGSRKAIAALFGCAIVAATMALLPSTKLSINESCQISGPIEKLRSVVQGQRYWANQLRLLDQEVQYLATLPDKVRNGQQMADETTSKVLEEHHKFMEELYEKHPELRPPRSQIVAAELRKQADANEHAEILEKIELLSSQRAIALKSCRPILVEATQ